MNPFRALIGLHDDEDVGDNSKNRLLIDNEEDEQADEEEDADVDDKSAGPAPVQLDAAPPEQSDTVEHVSATEEQPVVDVPTAVEEPTPVV